MTASRPRQVLIVDDHAVVREGLAVVIGGSDDFAIVGAVGSAREALELCEREPPDLVVLDLRMPVMDGLAALEVMQARWPRMRVVMLSSQDGDEAIYRALKLGAAGYVLKSAPSTELLATLRQVESGRPALSPDVAARLASRVAFSDLSEREIEVLRHVARGRSNKLVAGALNISASTVKNHLNNIMTKLSASDRTEAVTIALARGIIQLD